MNVATPTAKTTLKHARVLASVLLDQGDLLERVEARMSELAGNRATDRGAQMVHEHLETGGKRLRASLALSACQALGGRADHAVGWAAAVELLHNASLVHDDIQDGDRMRRGKAALWARYGSAQAISAGDLLLMLPFRALGHYPVTQQAALVQILAEYAERTVRGQICEHALTASAGSDWGTYFGAVSGKTGTLFALPVRGAAELAGVSTDHASDLARTFSSIGVLYQLQDDLLDLFDAKARGSRGSDIYAGRLTAVVLSHLDLHPNDADEVFAILGKPRDQTTAREVAQITDRFVEGGAARQLLERIERLASDLLAADSLREAPGIRAVAQELVHRVLAPLDLVKGAVRE
jgi:geranylgeranyl diphosphate synthase type I